MKGKILIDADSCKGCYLCIEACPKGLIQKSDNLNINSYYPAEFIDKDESCNGCMLCALICPEVSIEVYRKNEK